MAKEGDETMKPREGCQDNLEEIASVEFYLLKKEHSTQAPGPAHGFVHLSERQPPRASHWRQRAFCFADEGAGHKHRGGAHGASERATATTHQPLAAAVFRLADEGADHTQRVERMGE